MFERLFDRPATLARQRAGPLLEERLRYLSHLAEQGVARHGLQVRAYYLLVVAQCLRLAERPGELISRGEIEHQAHLWAQQPVPRRLIGSECQRAVTFRRHATQWLQFSGRLQPLPETPHRYAEVITAFANFLGGEKGLARTTIRACCSRVREFLDQLGSTASDSLGTITVTQVDETLAEYVAAGGYARTTVQEIVGKLRAFFRYAEMYQWCRPGLVAALKAPRVFAQGTLPVSPTWHEVQQALALTKGDQPVDIRDHALLLLLTVYGLRAGEVVRLRLNDLDWEQELFTVIRSKSGRSQIYPLSQVVGAALIHYLREARPPASLREVFVTRHPPFRPMDRGTLYLIVARRLRAVNPALAHYGPHALRHACATYLLEKGLSLKEIGDHLGHRHPDTTRIYAKVDLTRLRQVADFDLGGVL
jgi:site-specific recombinase XerD